MENNKAHHSECIESETEGVYDEKSHNETQASSNKPCQDCDRTTFRKVKSDESYEKHAWKIIKPIPLLALYMHLPPTK